jgi:allophanate hydrolase
VRDAARVLAVSAGPDARDPWSRTPPPGVPTAGVGPLRIGVPRAEQLRLDACARRTWSVALEAIASCGPVTEIDLAPYLDAGALLYGSALIAERWDAVGAFLDAHADGADPIVRMLIGRARELPAHQYAGDLDRVHRYAAEWASVWDRVDVVALPTVGEAPTLAEVAADPVEVNARLGRLTTGCNVLDLCAAAVPCGVRNDGIPFGVTFLGPAFADAVVAVAGARLTGELDPPPYPWATPVDIVVVGAHLRGQPLEHELTGRGARFQSTVRTAPRYRLYALPTDPPKPGLVRVADGGASIDAELWSLPVDGFGDLVRSVPAPLSIGTVELDSGTAHHGFLCEPVGALDAPDITPYRSWPAYLAARATTAPPEPAPFEPARLIGETP